MFEALWDKLDPGFLLPFWLLVGLVAVIAVVLLEVGAHRRRKQAVRLFAASHLAAALTSSVSPVKRLLKAALIVAATGLLFIALARPHLLYDWTEENRTGTDVLLAVDCSKSMLTEDVKPNRLERAKLAIADFADNVPDNRLGLIAFAGDAFLECPLTLDHDAFETAVRDLDTETIPRPGTDLASAIDLAVDSLRSQPNNVKFLILVTDGEDLEGRAVSAAKNAAQNGLRIFTVGVGTPEGERIPERDETGAVTYHHDLTGQEVVSKLDESTLRDIAESTGGAYVPLGQRGEGLEEIYDHYIAPLPKQNQEEQRKKIPIERFEWPLALAILFLMWEFMINERAKSAPAAAPSATGVSRPPVRRKTRGAVTTSATALAFVILGAARQAQASDTDTAERDYKAGQYDAAMQYYQKAAEGQPTRNDLEYNAGAAAYKAGDYSEAEEAFRKALETPDLNLQERTYYNLGNAQYQHGATMQKVDIQKTITLWEKALHSYDSAMKLKMSLDAKHNYDVVKAKLEQLKQQQPQGGHGNQPSQGNQGQSNQGDGQQQQPGQDDQDNGGQDSNQGHGGNQDEKPNPADKNSQSQGKVRAYSGQRAKDQLDPQIKSRQDAENLLDSLKEDERRVSARSLEGDNQPPPPPSGKDW